MTNCRHLDGLKCLHPNSGVDICVLLKPNLNPRPGVYITCKLEYGMPRPLNRYADGIHPRVASEK